MNQLQHEEVGTAAGGNGDLDGVPARLAYMLEVQGLVGGLVVPRSIVRGVALTLTCTEAGQLVFICRSS